MAGFGVVQALGQKEKMMKRITGLLFMAVLMLAACNTPIEVTARDGIAASKAVLIDRADAHPECGAIVNGAKSTAPANLTPAPCAKLKQGVAVKDLVIDALQVYCSGPQFEAGGACQPKAEYFEKLKAALTNLDQIISDVKKL